MTEEEFKRLTEKEIQQIFKDNLNVDPAEFALKNAGQRNLPIRAISEQIKNYKKAKKKLPELSNHKLIYDSTALEQASSEATARYKSKLLSGKQIIDLTGGLGIDDIFFSEKFDEVFYCEIQPVLVNIFEYNLTKLGIKNIKVNCIDSIDYLKTFEDNYFDWIFIDPARRDGNRRSVDLKYCKPDLINNLSLLENKSENICIKLSPAFDFTEAKRLFKNLSEFIVVSVDNECKEVLVILKRELENRRIKLKSVLLTNNSDRIMEFQQDENEIIQPEISNSVLDYFYEPDLALIKADMVSSIAKSFDLSLLSNDSVYLTSIDKHDDFPGRSFKVLDRIDFNEKKVKHYLKENNIKKANVAKRNFPLNVSDIRKKFKLKEGGSIYLFLTNVGSKKMMIVCQKI